MAPDGYQTSDGMGLLEFLNWCEDLNMEPVVAVYAGLSLNGTFVAEGERHQFVFADKRVPGEFIKSGPDLRPFVEDALDEIEYITGDAATTTWGARRAKDGHPAPFELNYVEVGNEDFFGASDYEGRFAQFYDAIRAKYPQLKIIATANITSRVPDVFDEHYYRSPKQFIEDAHHFDNYPRTGPKIFVGEWAATKGDGPTPDLEAALADAAWMIGMERNADIVIMQSYCELLGNVNKDAFNFGTNLIGYDALQSYGSPSYYVQLMFNSHRGDKILFSSPGIAPGMTASATQDTKTNTIYLKVVNANEVPKTVRLEISGVARLNPKGKEMMISGETNDTNSLKEPYKIIPIESELGGLKPTFDHVFPAHSIAVLELYAR
jgi:alpha-L-arabinofuranosidase